MNSTLLSGFPFQGQGGDQFVSRVVSAAIAALFRKSEHIEAQVRAEPVTKLLQGSIDGFDLIAQGLQMYNGLRIAGLELFSQAVAIDFSEIFRGQVKLRQPTQSRMRVVLTEEDLSISFNTPFVMRQMQKLLIMDQPLQLRDVKVSITNDGRLRIQGEVKGQQEWQPLDFSALVEVKDRHCVRFEQVVFGDAEPEMAQALVDHVNRILDLDTFALDGTQLRIDQVRVRDHKVVFYGSARIDKFPRRNAQDAGRGTV
jgi:hypothetical protein